MARGYVHGYSQREAERLHDQARSVRDLFHHDTHYGPGELVLEAACGVGAQTVTLATRSPGARFCSVDIARGSLEKARSLLEHRGVSNVSLFHADVFALPFSQAAFHHVWVSHLLEHVTDPVAALRALGAVLRPGGTITAVEGDHGSCYWHPSTEASRRAWQCLIDVQAGLGHDSLVGRQLFPLLTEAGFRDVRVSPRMVYADYSDPDLMDAFVRFTIIPMVEGVREEALGQGMIDESTWEKGIRDLHAVEEREDGVFCYTFFKGVGER